MKKGRSSYNFQLKCDINLAEQLIQSYMNANGFKLEENNGESYYKAGDAMMGYKYFNYSLNGNNLIIYAWLKGTFEEIGIEQKGLTSINMAVMNYKNSLNKLFQEIERLNVEDSNGGNMNNNNITGYDTNASQPIQSNLQSNAINNNQQNNGQTYPQNNNFSNNNQFAQTFQDETTKKQEKLCEIGFWIYIFGLITSFFGVAFGMIVYIMDFYFASQGLKTRKKGKAIATIVLSIISILIIILELVVSV